MSRAHWIHRWWCDGWSDSPIRLCWWTHSTKRFIFLFAFIFICLIHSISRLRTVVFACLRCDAVCCAVWWSDSIAMCISHGVVLSLILIKHIHLLLFLSQRISSLADSYCLPFLPSFFSVTTTFSFFCFLSFYFCLHISLEPWLHDDFIDSRGGAFYAML